MYVLGVRELCQQLAEGTTSQKRRAWRSLIWESGLWHGCQEALRRADAGAMLSSSYDYLSDRWDRGPLLTLPNGDATTIEQQLGEARRMVAAALVGALGRSPSASPPPPLCSSLTQWSARALGEDAGPEAGPLAHDLPEACHTLRLRHWFRRLGDALPQKVAQVAVAQDTALSLLESRSAPGGGGRPLRVPVLLARGAEGFLVWLWLERLDGGFGQFFQAPSTRLDPLRPELRAAVEKAWRTVEGEMALPLDQDIRWWMSNLPRGENREPVPVTGNSLEAAAAAGLMLFAQGRLYRPSCAISAALQEDGTLGPVDGLSGEAPKLWAARSLRPGDGPALVVVSPGNRLSAAEATEWEARGVHVLGAETLREALEHAAGEAAEAMPQRQTAEGGRRKAEGNRVVILHTRGTGQEEHVLRLLQNSLRARGFQVSLDCSPEGMIDWAREIEQRIHTADVVLPLLSEASVQSEMLAYEVQVAREAAQQTGSPRLIPVWIGEPGPLPEPLAGIIGPLHGCCWPGAGHDDLLLQELTATLTRPLEPLSAAQREQLIPPTGVLTLDSRYYLVRASDAEFRAATQRRDSIVRIKGARQVGKTSLLARGLQEARQQRATVILTDFQVLNQPHLDSAESFFRTLARWIAKQLHLDTSLEEIWDPLQGPNWNFREFMLYEVLERAETPVVWAIDEVDRLFPRPFASEAFGLFRSWHNERALNPDLPWSRLTLALSYATEAHLFLSDLNQSPFNVGTRILIEDFTVEQAADLNERYGAPLRGGAELEACHLLMGGHPYLTHRALHHMAVQNLEFRRLAAVADREDGVFGDHLRRLLISLAREPLLCEAMREVLQGRPCPDSDRFYRLSSAGVVTGDSPQTARPRCGLYARYLERQLL
jgi:hypothetical protein